MKCQWRKCNIILISFHIAQHTHTQGERVLYRGTHFLWRLLPRGIKLRYTGRQHSIIAAVWRPDRHSLYVAHHSAP